MDINDWSSNKFIKHLLADSNLTQKDLAEKVFESLGSQYTPNTFNNKIYRNDLKLKEVQAVCDILGYKLTVEKTGK